MQSPFPLNIRLFIWFRIFFNCRFYYPVFAILFLDYGMTLEQFALLNVAWAAAIVLLEVPSGALADCIGRRKMVIASAILMVVELCLLAFVPLGNGVFVFWVLILNRVLSGAAEATASGADEALAYDSLKVIGREKEWPDVLAVLMKRQSLAFVFAMLCGAVVYDASLLNRFTDLVNLNWSFTKQECLRFPVYLTLFMACGACVVSFQMREPPGSYPRSEFKFLAAWRSMREAGLWIIQRPTIWFFLIFLVVCDSIVRLHLTLGSQYLRLIQIPEGWFGLFSAAFAVLGLFAPKVAMALVEKRSWPWNLSALALYLFLSLLGLSLGIPYFGLIFSLTTSAGMFFLGYFSSHYLNAAIDSGHRATILSFKGLAMNLGYGLIGLSYAAYVGHLGEIDKNAAYAESIRLWPWYFAGMLGLLLLCAWPWRRALWLRSPSPSSL